MHGNWNIEIKVNLPIVSRVVPYKQTDGQTDMTKIIVAIRNFANAPNDVKNIF